MTEPLASTLTDAEIDRIEATTRADLHYAITGLAALREADAHTRRGFPDWHSYVLDRFGDLLAQLRIPREVRLTLVDSMDQAGMTVREIADKIGVSKSQVQNDREQLGKVIPIGRKRRPKCPQPTGKKYEVAVEYLRRYGEQGLTLVELAQVAGWSEGSASGVLSDLVQRKRLAVRTEQRRDGQRVHLLAEAASATA